MCRTGSPPFMFNYHVFIWHLNYFFYGPSRLPSFYDHLITMFLHVITCLLISQHSIIGAFVFACHPCNHMTSIWLTGRRYSILNILFLLSPLTFLCLSPALIACVISEHRNRSHLFQPPITPLSILKTLILSLQRLSGLFRHSFLYPYDCRPFPSVVPATFLPHTQPVSERYLSIPLIILCSYLPPIAIVLLPVYAFRTIQLMPMYHSIQSFYNYHATAYPTLPKLALLRRLYKSII